MKKATGNLATFCLVLYMTCCYGCGAVKTTKAYYTCEGDQHVRFTDGHGRLICPERNPSAILPSFFIDTDEKDFQEETKCLTPAANEIARQIANGKDVVIFFHGGMNTLHDTLDRTNELTKYAQDHRNEEGKIPYFFFINWDSSLRSSYFDHLFRVREGRSYYRDHGLFYEKINDLFGILFYLPSDILAGIARSPVTLERQLVTFTESLSMPDNMSRSIRQAIKRLNDLKDQKKIRVTHLDEKNEKDYLVTGLNTLTGPFRIITTPIIDTFGEPAWDVMQRRTTILFDREVPDAKEEKEENLAHLKEDGPVEKELGPLYQLGRALKKVLPSNKMKKRGNLILISHSMGTIIAGEFLKEFPEIHFDRIIFMAAACSVRYLGDIIAPYLARPENRETKFYNLMLHPLAEVRESYLYGVAPIGTLLVWIDQWFEKPDSVLDRTAGRYVNIGLNGDYLVKSMNKFQDKTVSSRCFFKAFPYRSKSEPQDVPMTHGAFDDFRFWKENFWKLTDDDSIGYKKWLNEE